jgi:hypothetical protein
VLVPRGDISLWDRCRELRMLGVEVTQEVLR